MLLLYDVEPMHFLHHMPSSQALILIKGEPKGLQIEKISLENKGLYAVKFKNSPQTFHYRYNDVVILDNAVWYDPMQIRVLIGGHQEWGITDVFSYTRGFKIYWRITYKSGYTRDLMPGTVELVHSCLSDDKARNVFEYLKRIAQTNELGKDEEHGGILPSLYDSIDFVPESLAAAPYLAPSRHFVKKHNSGRLIFPFGCNASQERAVTAAFEEQISVIQGPPGTGKTQTILNIIANLLLQGKTAIVVSNNNSATTNVQEKLQKYGLDFIVAPLGKRENKEEFIKAQPKVPEELKTWKLTKNESDDKKQTISDTLIRLREAYSLQEELATFKQEIKDLEMEWEHFKQDNHIEDNTYTPKNGISSKQLMRLWLNFQVYADGDAPATGLWHRLMERLRLAWLIFKRKHILGIQSPFNKVNIPSVVEELQALYYQVRLKELSDQITYTEKQLATLDAKALNERLSTFSIQVLKDELYSKYNKVERYVYTTVNEIRKNADEFVKQYPVVLSTTFSARTAIPDMEYDYLIMDEASQVSIETGALALTCAKNAVIVGDTLQLPNVVNDEDRLKLNGIFNEYKVAMGYNCADNSFLQSVCKIMPNVKKTLLREHYRCHPKIINFCNQRFYGGNLLIMTQDHDEENVLMAIRTAPGHHARGHYNQREIDVVKQEVLPTLKNGTDVGIITPYNQQVDEFNAQLPTVEAATIHKYQGREKDTIIMSVVDDQITEFSDNPNLLNVAISRAKKNFCLVISGNEQEHKGNITELIDYITYNNFQVTESKITSIFDYLYSQYTSERLAFLSKHKNISEYDSENLTFSLIENILKENPEYSYLGVLCHTPIRTFIKDWSLLNDDERKYISHYSTHVDFLIVNHVTRKPVFAVETDGYNYHNDETDQHKRDLMKNHILEVYGMPLLRLSTTGSGENEKILSFLKQQAL